MDVDVENLGTPSLEDNPEGVALFGGPETDLYTFCIL
jgi:hypothetical protein